jgi:prepilin-type N-terminal cleavage/methylation domain-containing protein
MKLTTTSPRRQAFTLIELLVVIAIIGILFTIVSPQLSKARLRGKMTQQAHHARSIVEAIISMEGASRFGGGWPQSGDTNATSAAVFLASLVDGGFLDVEYSFFAGPGMIPARNQEEFLGDPDAHNTWLIMLDLDDGTPGNFPAVYMKNLDITTLTFAEDAEPLGDKGFTFSTKNGEAVIVERAEMNSDDFQYIFNLQEVTDIQVMDP